MMADETKPEAAPEAAPATKPEAAAPAMTQAELAELAELRGMKAEHERRAAEAEKAKLTEAERLKTEREELARDRFLLEVERAGVPSDLVEAVASGDPKRVAKAWTKAEEAISKKFKQGPAGAQVNPATGAGEVKPGQGATGTEGRYFKLLRGKR